MPTSRATIILYFDVVLLLYQIEIKYSSVFMNLRFKPLRHAERATSPFRRGYFDSAKKRSVTK